MSRKPQSPSERAQERANTIYEEGYAEKAGEHWVRQATGKLCASVEALGEELDALHERHNTMRRVLKPIAQENASERIMRLTQRVYALERARHGGAKPTAQDLLDMHECTHPFCVCQATTAWEAAPKDPHGLVKDTHQAVVRARTQALQEARAIIHAGAGRDEALAQLDELIMNARRTP